MLYDEIVEVNGARFHGVWLRDNCLCAECRHPTSAQKIFDYTALPEPPRIERLIRSPHDVVVHWREEPAHVSRFPVDWLMDHRYDGAGGTAPIPTTTWNAAEIRTKHLEMHDLRQCAPDAGPWVQDLLAHGFALFRGVTLDGLDRFLSAIGPVHPTEYGRFAHIQSTPDAGDLAETGYALTAHTDYSTYMHVAPLLQLMYFEEQAATGGESLLVDGFRVGEDFRRAHPRFFEILVRTPVEFQQRYGHWQYHFVRKRPVLEVDGRGNVSGIFFGHSHCYDWTMPFDEVAAFYEAYAALFRYLKSPEYVFTFRLGAGEGVAVRNARVLHGRRAFDPSSGRRHLITAYVPWEYLEARLRFIERPRPPAQGSR